MTLSSTRQFARNASALSFTSVLRIVLNLALRFAIARYLGEIGFGQYSIFIAYSTVFQVVAELGLPRLVIREAAHRREDIAAYWRAALVAEAGGAIVAGLIMAALAVGLHYTIETTQLLLLGALMLLPYVIVSTTEACCQALERMEVIALVQSAALAFQVSGSVALLATGKNVVWLGIIALAAQAFTASMYLVLLKRLGLWSLSRPEQPISTLRRAWQLVRTAPDFFALAVSNVTFSKLDTLLLSVFLGEALTGVYNAAFLVVQVLSLLAVGYTDALYPRLARLYKQVNRGQFTHTIHQALRFGLMALVPVVLATSLLSAPLIAILYRSSLRVNAGDQIQAVTALRILSWFAVPFLINAVLGGALMASGRQRASLYVSLIKLAAALVYYLAGIHFLGIVGAGIATLLTGLTAIALNGWYVTRDLARVRWQHVLLKPLVASLIMGMVVMGLSLPLGNTAWIAPVSRIYDVAIAVAAGTITYLGALTALGGLTAQDRKMARALLSRQSVHKEGLQP